VKHAIGSRRRTMHSLTIAMCASVSLTGGCSLVYSSDLDAARSLEASALSDASPEGAPTDAPADEPATTTDAGPTRGCAAIQPRPKFCRDFDDDGAVGQGWSNVTVEPGGPGQIVSLDTDQFWSGRQSFRARMQGVDAGCSYTRLDQRFSNTGAKRFEVHVRLRPSSPWKEKAPFVMSVGGCAALLYLSERDGRVDEALINVQSGNRDDVRSIAGHPPVDEWTDFGIVVIPSPTGSGTKMTFSFTDADGTVTEKSHEYSYCALGGDAFLGVGFHCDRGDAEVRYDDVRADWE
jgi:hypothetical protein